MIIEKTNQCPGFYYLHFIYLILGGGGGSTEFIRAIAASKYVRFATLGFNKVKENTIDSKQNVTVREAFDAFFSFIGISLPDIAILMINEF